MIDASSFWNTLGERPIGVSLVTASGVEGFFGFLALSAAHVSSNPPSMSVSIDDRTTGLAAIMHSRHFAVSYLRADQRSLAQIFSGRTSLKGADRFAEEDWETLASGAPVLRQAVAVFDCSLVDTWRYESTTIALGRVIGMRKGGGDALVFFRGDYVSL